MAAALELEYDVQRVDDARNVSQDGKQDVDEEVSIAAALEKDAQRRQDDGEEDLAYVAGGERHGSGGSGGGGGGVDGRVDGRVGEWMGSRKVESCLRSGRWVEEGKMCRVFMEVAGV